MRALVLAGGGSRGSWEAGVLKYMGEDPQFAEGFDFGSGTSVGAINMAGIAMFPPTKFPEACKHTLKLWSTYVKKTSDIWKLRTPFGIPGLWNPSVGVNSRLDALLTELVDIDAIVASGMESRYVAVDMETGEVIHYTQSDLAAHGIKPIAASSSYPLAFPPVEIDGRWLSDGGLRDTAPLGAAIEAGAEDIVVLCTRDPRAATFKDRKEMGNMFTFGIRCLSLQMLEVLATDVKLCETHNHWAKLKDVLRDNGVADGVIGDILAEMKPKKQVRLQVIYPSRPLGPSLDFSGEMMKEQIALGYSDAKAFFGG